MDLGPGTPANGRQFGRHGREGKFHFTRIVISTLLRHILLKHLFFLLKKKCHAGSAAARKSLSLVAPSLALSKFLSWITTSARFP